MIPDNNCFNLEKSKECISQWRDGSAVPLLPAWEELPSIPLYMDQVVYLINSFLSDGKSSSEKTLTPAMINNYIKQKIMPPTIKKHYFRQHLACLIIICVLKESVNISDIEHLLSKASSEEEMKQIYEDFLSIYRSTRDDCISYIDQIARNTTSEDDTQLMQFILRLSVSSAMTVTLAKDLLSFHSSKASLASKKKEKGQAKNQEDTNT